MGFNYEVTINNKTRAANLLLFAGFVNKPDEQLYRGLTLLNIFICPVFMVVVHAVVIFLNRRKIKAFYEE